VFQLEEAESFCSPERDLVEGASKWDDDEVIMKKLFE
jgi:hypothetical protein